MKKQYVYIYECPKCKFHKDIINGNENCDIKCKICGTKMIFNYKRKYDSNNGLNAIKDSNRTNNAQKNTMTNMPKCPTCNSTNVKRISGTRRWISAGLFGLASSNIGKTMECRNCGYKW